MPDLLRTLSLTTALSVGVATPLLADDAPFKVVTTFTVLADMAQNVAGEAAEVVSITKPGAETYEGKTNPHAWMGLDNALIYIAYGGVLYVDSLSEAGGPVPTYLDLLRVTSETVATGLVNMQDFRHRQIGELSGGQRKRVFLARSLAQDGQVILLDEPFTGVDVKTEEQIVALLRELKEEGRVMLVSTHNLGSVPEFCDRTVLVKRTVLAHGPTEEVFTRQNLEMAFGGVLRHFTIGGSDLHDDDDAREVRSA